MDDRYLSPSEVAKRFGLSIKALRHYESCGLLAPKRTSNGSTGSAWRVYGPDQVARLHQILALKRLGLSLARIGEILAGPDRLVAVLALQEQALVGQGEQLARALALVRAAQAKLKSGLALSIDDLATLNQETVVTRLTSKEMHRIMTPFGDQHFSAAEKEALRAKIPDRDQFIKGIDDLVAEAQPLMQAGDPTSPAALDLARRFAAHTKSFAEQRDPQMRAKTEAVLADAMKDPETARKIASNLEIMRFIKQAVDHLNAPAK